MLSAKQAVREWGSLYNMASTQALQLYGPTHGGASRKEHDSYLDKFREPYYSDGLSIRQNHGNQRQDRKNNKFFKEILTHTRKWRSRYSYMYQKDEWETDVGRHALAAFGLAMQL